MQRRLRFAAVVFSILVIMILGYSAEAGAFAKEKYVPEQGLFLRGLSTFEAVLKPE